MTMDLGSAVEHPAIDWLKNHWKEEEHQSKEEARRRLRGEESRLEEEESQQKETKEAKQKGELETWDIQTDGLRINTEQASEFIKILLLEQVEEAVVQKISSLLRSDPTLANKTTQEGFTPFMIAAWRGMTKVMDCLLKYGKKKNGEDIINRELGSGIYKGVNALWLSAKSPFSWWDDVQYLLELPGLVEVNSAPKAGPHQGETPLWLALTYEGEDEEEDAHIKVDNFYIARMLIDKGARDTNHRTPEFLAETELTQLLDRDWAGDIGEEHRLKLIERGWYDFIGTTESENPGSTVIWRVYSVNPTHWQNNLRLFNALLKYRISPTEVWKTLDASPKGALDVLQLNVLQLAVQRNDDMNFRRFLARGASLEIRGSAVNFEVLEKLLAESTSNQRHHGRTLANTLQAAKTLFLLANKGAAWATGSDDKLLGECLEILESSLNGRVNDETALAVAMRCNTIPVIEALAVAGAILPFSYSSRDSESYFLQACCLVKEVECQSHQLLLEFSSHKVDEIEKINENILDSALGETLQVPHRNKLYYRLGELLENSVSFVPKDFKPKFRTMAIEAFRKISPSSDLYKGASEKVRYHQAEILQASQEQSMTLLSETIRRSISASVPSTRESERKQRRELRKMRLAKPMLSAFGNHVEKEKEKVVKNKKQEPKRKRDDENEELISHSNVNAAGDGRQGHFREEMQVDSPYQDKAEIPSGAEASLVESHKKRKK